MKRTSTGTSKKLGSMPGSLIYVGIQREEAVAVRAMQYNKTELSEATLEKVEDALGREIKGKITWLNFTGVHDTTVVNTVGDHYHLHPLTLEDIVNTGQRAKLEESDGHIYLVLKMLLFDETDDDIRTEQISVILGPDYVITFEETTGEVFDFVRDRIRKTVPRVRFMHADYLAYALVDAIVDHYFIILERLGETVAEMEQELMTDPAKEHLERLLRAKRHLVHLHKTIWPVRELIAAWERSDSPLISASTRVYLRDLYDHVIQIVDTVESSRDMVSGLMDIYLSSVSNRMNEVMKVLTMIATIFIPLSFLAGVYGMNFDTEASPFNLPELEFPYGYVLFWLVAVVIAAVLIAFFKRKRWM